MTWLLIRQLGVSTERIPVGPRKILLLGVPPAAESGLHPGRCAASASRQGQTRREGSPHTACSDNEDEDDLTESCRADDDDRDRDEIDDEDENDLRLRSHDADSDDDGVEDGDEDRDRDAVSNEDAPSPDPTGPVGADVTVLSTLGITRFGTLFDVPADFNSWKGLIRGDEGRPGISGGR